MGQGWGNWMAALGLLLALLAGCAAPEPPAPLPTLTAAPPPSPTPVLLRVVGATAMVPLLRELSAAYALDARGVLVEVSGGGTGAAIAALRTGQGALGMASRPLSAAEAEGLTVWPLARDGLAVIVHPSNPINRLSRSELRDLFSGERFLWDEFGWLAGTVQVASRETGSGDRAALQGAILGPERRVALNAALLPTSDAMLDFVADTPQAIGVVSAALLRPEVKVIRVDEQLPLPATVAAGRYPFTRELGLLLPSNPSQEAVRFLEWLQGPAARAIIERRYAPP